jgi:acetyltransferase-like isoleucine patch superfamily enzyme
MISTPNFRGFIGSYQHTMLQDFHPPSLPRRILGSSVPRLIALAIMEVGGLIERLCSFVRTRALFPNCPDVVCSWNTEIKYPENITFGSNVQIGPGCTIGAKAPIFFGDHVLLSKGVVVETGTADVSTPPPYARTSKPIRIERGVWLGARVMVMGGVTIGANSIVAAGTIVRKSVPPNTFVVSERAVQQSFGTSPD